jgi:sugar (pentulose or hexulose) kinase
MGVADIRNVAVIDVGKTNGKVALFDVVEGRESHVHSTANTVLKDGPYPHYDIERLWTFFLDSLRAIGTKETIDAIAITAHGASITLVDAEGNLALPVLDYEFDGPDRLKAEYDAIRPPFAETGSPRLVAGLNVGAQLYWQARTFPDAFARVTSIMPYPQYWSMRLTGVRASEPTSIGAHTDLWNPHTRRYSSLVDRMGWRDLMPPVGSAFDILGTLRPEIAEATGLRATTPVFSGIHDSNASLLTHLKADDPPFAVVSTGTWVICFSVGGKAITLDEARDTLVNVNAFGDPVPSSRFMGGRVFAMLDADPKAVISAADRDAVLDGGIMLMPAIPDDSGPFVGRKGGWRGDPRSLTPGGFLYAVSLYLGMMTSVSLELIGADGPVVVEGPLAANRTFLEALQAVTGRPVMTGGSGVTGTAAGTALLAIGRDARITSHGTVADTTPDPRIPGYAAEWRRIAENHQG